MCCCMLPTVMFGREKGRLEIKKGRAGWRRCSFVQEQQLQARGCTGTFVFFGRGGRSTYSSILSLPCFPCTYIGTCGHDNTGPLLCGILSISSVIVGRSTTTRQLWLLGRVYCFVIYRTFVFKKWSVHVAITYLYSFLLHSHTAS